VGVKRTSAQCIAALNEARIPCGPVLTPQEALADPHIVAKKFMKDIDYPGLPRPAPVARTPVNLTGTPVIDETRAPTLGEHVGEILAELGYGAAEIATLREKRVI